MKSSPQSHDFVTELTTQDTSVIEARVQELGGEPSEETVQDRADRLARALKFKERRNRFLNFDEGPIAADRAFEELAVEIQRLAEEINGSENSITLTVKRAGAKIVILGFDLGLSVVWRSRYSNTLTDAALIVDLWDGHPHFPGIMLFEEPNRLNSLKFSFDILPTEQHVWCASTSDGRQYSSKELASFTLKHFMGEGLKRIGRR